VPSLAAPHKSHATNAGPDVPQRRLRCQHLRNRRRQRPALGNGRKRRTALQQSTAASCTRPTPLTHAS
jgi:hypothetical protein